MHPSADKWLSKIGRLRIDRKDNPAPHKPLLLMTVIDMVEKGLLKEPILPFTGELTFRFMTLWPVVAGRRSQAPEVWLPFYHLRTSGVWLPLDASGNPTEERRRVASARIDFEFFACLLEPDFRRQLRMILVDRYFTDPAERAALAEFAGITLEQTGELNDRVGRYEVALRLVREVRFRLGVVPAYDYTCALTGYRLITANAGSIVDAAHIHQFAKSGNNDLRNGIALSKNAHWSFDQGLWSLTDDYRVTVAKERFCESGSPALLLSSFEGQRIHLPKREDEWPELRHLEWHRRNKLGRIGAPTERSRTPKGSNPDSFAAVPAVVGAFPRGEIGGRR